MAVRRSRNRHPFDARARKLKQLDRHLTAHGSGLGSGRLSNALVNVSALPETRLGNAVEPGVVFCARPAKPFERGRPVCGRRVSYVNSIGGRNGVKVCPGCAGEPSR